MLLKFVFVMLSTKFIRVALKVTSQIFTYELIDIFEIFNQHIKLILTH